MCVYLLSLNMSWGMIKDSYSGPRLLGIIMSMCISPPSMTSLGLFSSSHFIIAHLKS